LTKLIEFVNEWVTSLFTGQSGNKFLQGDDWPSLGEQNAKT